MEYLINIFNDMLCPFQKQYGYNAVKYVLHDITKRKYEEKVKYKEYYWHLFNKFPHLTKAISSCENIYINFKNKDESFWKTIFKMPFICSRQTTIQTFQYKITHRILVCNEWLNNIKIKIYNTCSFCNDKDTISHFPIDCNSNKCFGKS